MPWRDEETILGPTQRLTPEGFLLCKDVPIARTGEQLYHATELPLLGIADGMIRVARDEAEVFDPASMASFAGKPIVDDHPDDWIVPDNIASHQIGTVANVRRSGGLLLADLLFTARRGIDLVRGGKRAVSVGYDARYEQTGPGTARQRRIRCNHVALVDEGRCGPTCSIGDSARRRTMRNETSREAVARLAHEWRTRTVADAGGGEGRSYPTKMPPLLAMRANDAAWCGATLRAMNLRNAQYWTGGGNHAWRARAAAAIRPARYRPRDLRAAAPRDATAREPGHRDGGAIGHRADPAPGRSKHRHPAEPRCGQHHRPRCRAPARRAARDQRRASRPAWPAEDPAMNNQQVHGVPVPIGGPTVRVMNPDGTSEVVELAVQVERERAARVAATAHVRPGMQEFHMREQVRRLQDRATPWTLPR
jgi:hypothetical protein